MQNVYQKILSHLIRVERFSLCTFFAHCSLTRPSSSEKTGENLFPHCNASTSPPSCQESRDSCEARRPRGERLPGCGACQSLPHRCREGWGRNCIAWEQVGRAVTVLSGAHCRRPLPREKSPAKTARRCAVAPRRSPERQT